MLLTIAINHRRSASQFWIAMDLHIVYFLLQGATTPSGPGPPHCRGFTITIRHTTLGRAPLGEWSARRKDLCLTTHNAHKRQTSMPVTRFKPTIPASERLQTHALDRAAARIGLLICSSVKYLSCNTCGSAAICVRLSFRYIEMCWREKSDYSCSFLRSKT
jgi:hypothetical protein